MIQLSQAETIAARMFFNVSVQSAFALEDPNARFAAEFQMKDMIGYKGASRPQDVERQMYEVPVADGKVALETNPKDSPALSRVLVQGARRDVLVDTILGGFDRTGYFEAVDQGPVGIRTGRGTGHEALPGSQVWELVIDPKFGSGHNVIAMLVAREAGQAGGEVLELMAWPIAKTARNAQGTEATQ